MHIDQAHASHCYIQDPELGRMAAGYVLVEKAHLNIRNALLEMAGCDARVLLELLRDMSAVLGEQSAGTAILAKCCGPAILTRLERPWGPTEATVAIPLLHGWVQRHARLMKLPEDINVEQALADIVQYEDDETGNVAFATAGCQCQYVIGNGWQVQWYRRFRRCGLARLGGMHQYMATPNRSVIRPLRTCLL